MVIYSTIIKWLARCGLRMAHWTIVTFVILENIKGCDGGEAARLIELDIVR